MTQNQAHRQAPGNLKYAQVVKHLDERGRITSIETRVIFGTEALVIDKLEEADCYTTISTGHIKRQPLCQTDEFIARQEWF